MRVYGRQNRENDGIRITPFQNRDEVRLKSVFLSFCECSSPYTPAFSFAGRKMPSSSDRYVFTESFQAKLLGLMLTYAVVGNDDQGTFGFHLGNGGNGCGVFSVPVPSAAMNPASSWK